MKFKSLQFKRRGAIGILLLNRPEKRNALSDAMVEEIDACLAAVPEDVRALVLHGAGKHFCAGLDLAELSGRSAAQGMLHSRGWLAAAWNSPAPRICASQKQIRSMRCPRGSAAFSSAAAPRFACRV